MAILAQFVHAQAQLSVTILGVEVSAPVLIGDEVAMTQDVTPAPLRTTTFRGDTYRFQVELHH